MNDTSDLNQTWMDDALRKREIPIDFWVTRSKVKVTVAINRLKFWKLVSGCYLLNDILDLYQTWMDDAQWEKEDAY